MFVYFLLCRCLVANFYTCKEGATKLNKIINDNEKANIFFIIFYSPSSRFFLNIFPTFKK